MAMRVGFHLEGWDYLIVRALLARLLDVPESELLPDQVTLSSRGWTTIVQVLPQAIQRFYQRCCQFAVIGIDNDGNLDVGKTGQLEDPRRPRHWNHHEKHDQCRYCLLQGIVEQTRLGLRPLPQKPAASWPILLAVPVESIEAWLLSLRVIVAGQGGLYFEKELRKTLKQRFYGRPEATQGDVEEVALPLIRGATAANLATLSEACQSFQLLTQQVEAARGHILGSRDCWAPDDQAAAV